MGCHAPAAVRQEHMATLSAGDLPVNHRQIHPPEMFKNGVFKFSSAKHVSRGGLLLNVVAAGPLALHTFLACPPTASDGVNPTDTKANFIRD